MTDVQGRCPACGGSSLFLGSGGHVTCSRIHCSNPCAADELLHGESRQGGLHDVEIRSPSQRMVMPDGQPPAVFLAGDGSSRISLDGKALTVASSRPVIVESFSQGADGGVVTLSLVCGTIQQSPAVVGADDA